MASHRIVTLPGDGIGPEILAAATASSTPSAPSRTRSMPSAARRSTPTASPLTDATTAACRAADAVLLAAVGGPKWDSTDPSAARPEQGLLGIRKALGLYANLRPVRPLPALYDASPLKRELIDGIDLLVVRELTGGIYFGAKSRTDDLRVGPLRVLRPGDRADRADRVRRGPHARDLDRQDERARDRPAVARGRVTRVHAEEFPDVELEHQLVDSRRDEARRRPAGTST